MRTVAVIRTAAVIVAAGGVLAGCGQQATATQASAGAPSAAPAPDAVVVRAYCGPRQVYWQGTWWQADGPLVPVRGEGEEREVAGTMTVTGPGQARLDSPQLVGSQTMSDTGAHQQNQPPYPPCGP